MTSDYVIVQFAHRETAAVLPYAEGRVVKMQCGAVAGRLPGFDLYDDTCAQTSGANACFSEATGIYAATRSAALPHSSYYGFAQYRRYLDFDPRDLSESRILCSKFNIGGTVLDQYKACHPLIAYVEFMSRLARCDSELHERIKTYFEKSSDFYRANCFVMPAPIFAGYSDFVSYVMPIMVDAKTACDSAYDTESPYQKRYMSFLFERLTSFWIADHARRVGFEILDRHIIDIDIPNKENGTR